MQLSGPDDMDVLAVRVNEAKSLLLRRAGASPAQAVFGRNPRLPPSILNHDDQSKIDALHHLTTDQQAMREEMVRIKALQSLIEYENNTHLRRALLRKGVPLPGRLHAR